MILKKKKIKAKKINKIFRSNNKLKMLKKNKFNNFKIKMTFKMFKMVKIFLPKVINIKMNSPK
jgi:hypothetical protein